MSGQEGGSLGRGRPRPRPSRAETRNMGMARHRNRLEERSLGVRVDDLRSSLRGRCNRLSSEMGQLEHHLKTMTMTNPLGGGSNKPLICPKGLTAAEKAHYIQMRRNSYTPSMNLEGFDLRMSDLKQALAVYRRTSLSSDLRDTVFNDAGIVTLEEHKFCAPITKHKHAMKEVKYFRSSSTDGLFAIRPKKAESPRPRCKSATAGGSRVGNRQQIVLCPDYIAARRTSMGSMSLVDSNLTNKTETQHL
ncbi:hypothetical protein ACOMHN_015739 [Nucella lapillus]